MNCEEKRNLFQQKLTNVQEQLQRELTAISEDIERRAKEISDDFNADNDLAEGVGASAGTVIGGVIGGPVGAVAGGGLGKVIGSLFTVEIGLRTEKVSLDVPQITMETQDFSFDLPIITIKDADIIFDLPTVRMTTVRGPDIPEIEFFMGPQCISLPVVGDICTDTLQTRTVMKPTYYDKPEFVMEPNRISVGLPHVEMQRQELKFDVPAISLITTEFSADFPYVTIRFIKDAGKRTAALSAALAQQAQDAGLQKQIAFKDRLKNEISPLAVDMFNCFRSELLTARSKVIDNFSSELSSISNVLVALKAKGVPDDDNDYISTKKHLEDTLDKQNKALQPLDSALEKLDRSAKETLERFLSGSTKSAPHGGLLKYNNPSPKNKESISSSQKVSGLISYTDPE